MPLNPPQYTDVTSITLANTPGVPWEVRDLRRTSADVYQYIGTPVLIKKMYTTRDVTDGIAQKVATFDYVMGQSEYWGDVLSHGIGICSIETQPGEWFGSEDPDNPDIFTIIESNEQPFPWFVPAPKYRGYGPGFLTYVILPDRPEDQWKLSEQGALTRMQTATVQLPWYPEVGDNDILITCALDNQGRITETYERYQLKQMSPISMHGVNRRGARGVGDGPITANNNRMIIGYAGEISKIPDFDIAYSIEVDR
jgi:hypothetical protein